MRTRLAVATALLGALALAAPSALAGPAPKTLDGKKITKMEITATSDLQNNVDNPVPESCVAPRCAMLPFVYNPAKGVKGDVLFNLTWSNPVSDLDLYVAEVGKNSNTDVAHCGTATVNTKERVFVPAGTLKRGKTYALVIDFFRSINETAKGTITMPAAAPSNLIPREDSTTALVNCQG